VGSVLYGQSIAWRNGYNGNECHVRYYNIPLQISNLATKTNRDSKCRLFQCFHSKVLFVRVQELFLCMSKHPITFDVEQYNTADQMNHETIDAAKQSFVSAVVNIRLMPIHALWNLKVRNIAKLRQLQCSLERPKENPFMLSRKIFL